MQGKRSAQGPEWSDRPVCRTHRRPGPQWTARSLGKKLRHRLHLAQKPSDSATRMNRARVPDVRPCWWMPWADAWQRRLRRVILPSLPSILAAWPSGYPRQGLGVSLIRTALGSTPVGLGVRAHGHCCCHGKIPWCRGSGQSGPDRGSGGRDGRVCGTSLTTQGAASSSGAALMKGQTICAGQRRRFWAQGWSWSGASDCPFCR